MQIEEYSSLLLRFCGLPQTNQEKTFMEVQRKPHFENVCSNILAFYFDPNEEHGFREMFLRGFMKMVESEVNIFSTYVDIRRECTTSKNNRLDIIIEGDDFIIGIENKIYHWVANDLKDYSDKIDSLGDKKIKFKIVLGIKKESPETLYGDFKSYTYEQLWKNIRAILGDYIINLNSKWTFFLMDFMETTARLSGENMDLSKIDEFFIKEKDLIEKLITQHRKFIEKLNNRIQKIYEGISIPSDLIKIEKRLWSEKEAGINYLVFDFYFVEGMVALDIIISSDGWRFGIFPRKGAQIFFDKLIKQEPLNVQDTDGSRRILKRWSLNDPTEQVEESIVEWIGKILETAKKLEVKP